MGAKTSLSPEDGNLIAQAGSVQVRELKHLRWLHFGTQAVQALMDVRSPSVPKLAYSRGMCLASLIVAEPSRALNLGVGGATFERYWASYLPQVRVHSVESDSRVLELAREHFSFPATNQYSVIVADARDAVLKLNDSHSVFDLVYCDLFDATSHPTFYYQRRFFASISAILSSSGVLTINTLPADHEDLVRILLPLRDEFPHVMALEFDQHKNVILFASRNAFLNPAAMQEKAQAWFDKTGIDLRSEAGRLFSLPPHI